MLNLNKRLIWISGLLVLAVFLTGCSAEAKKNRYAKRADKYFSEGLRAQAEVEYFNVLRLDQTNAHAIRQLGVLYSESGRIMRAIPFLAAASKLNTNDTEIQLKLSLVYIALGGFKEARTWATNVLQIAPQDKLAPLLLAESARTPEDIKDARQRFQILVRSQGETAPLAVALGSLLIREGKLTEAEALLRKSIQSDPKYPTAHHTLGLILWSKTNLTEAEVELKTAADLAEPRSPQKMQYAEFLLKAGKIEEGKKYLTEMTGSVPDYLPVWILLAETAFTEKKYPECEKLLNEALARDQDYFEAVLLSGRLKLATGQADKAIKDLERLSTLFPKSAPVHFYLSLARLQQGDSTKALAELNEAIKLNPTFDDAILQQAQLNIRLGNAPVAINSLGQLIKRRPDDANAYVALAAAHFARNNFDEGLNIYRQMEKIFPENPQVPLFIGLVLQHQGKNSEAREAFQKSFRLAPENLQPIERLVDLDIAEKKFAEATRLVEEQLQKSSQAAELQSLFGKILLAQENPAEAEKAFRKALELKPDFMPARRFLIEIYVSSKKYQLALDELQNILADAPKDQTSLLQLGLVQSELKHYSAAAEAYEKYFSLNPKASAALNNLAYLYSEHLNQLDKAYETARKARELLPNDPAIADTLGWILYKRHEYPRALNLLQESAEKLPREPDVFFHLGSTQYMLGDAESARISLRRALQAGLELPSKEEADSRLAVIDLNEKDPNTASTLEKVLNERPNDAIAISKLAGIYEKNQQVEKALKLYQTALEQNPKNLTAALKLTQLYSGPFKDNQKAMQYAKVARSLAPDDPNIAYNLGTLAYACKDHARSLTLLQECQRKLPQNADVLYDLALSYCSLGRITEAQSTMEAALKANSNFSRTDSARRFLRLISFYLEPLKASPPVGELQDAFKANPDDLPALMVTGTLKEQNKEVGAAKAVYEQILQQYPLFMIAHKRLAVLQALPQGDSQKAYEHALKARTAFPEDSEVSKILGILTYNQHDYVRAAQLLRESSLKRPQDGECLVYLGLSLHQLKQKIESQQILRKALNSTLAPALAQQANQILAESK